MSDRQLSLLAREAGLSATWTDAGGATRTVSPDTLRAALKALSLPAESADQIAESRAHLRDRRESKSALLIVKPGATVGSGKAARAAPDTPGYYEIDGQQIAVVPPRAWSMADAAPGEKLWGIAAQIYALRGGTTQGFGDFAALGELAADAAAQGAEALAINPVHALFGADPGHYGPYSPSTRLFLNPLYAALPSRPGRDDAAGFIDWPEAAQRKLAALRDLYAVTMRDEAAVKAIKTFSEEGGPRLLAHARFEALDARFRKEGLRGWRNWPPDYRHSNATGVRALSPADPEIAFQIFLQWIARDGMAAVQAKARDAGMRIGLIADMAIGMDPSGSHAWDAPGEVLEGLSIGAPPDLFNRTGQNWGLTGLSPLGLQRTGFSGFIETLRAAMANAGGIRLDHAMGLMRLWVIPDGATAADGVYLNYPFEEMLGLLTLESWRHRAIVIAEDLGTVPEGFRPRIAQAGLHGMRVLWFERDAEGAFIPPEDWDATAAALSTTHDLPTLAGWWRGRDIAWQAKLGKTSDRGAARRERDEDRRRLWQALRESDCAEGPPPPASSVDKPVDAALSFLGRTPCPLALIPLEDFVGEVEQPNLPGTIDEHPNWRQRLKDPRPLSTRKAARRAAILNSERNA